MDVRLFLGGVCKVESTGCRDFEVGIGWEVEK